MNSTVAATENPPSGLESDVVQTAKGILILLIVLGHNAFFQDHLHDAYLVLYTFHVTSFLFLPMVLPLKAATREFIRDRVVRYFVPFVVFYSISAILFLVVSYLPDNRPVSEWLINFVMGLFTSSTTWINKASGFKMYWFLPVLIWIVIAVNAWSEFDKRDRLFLFLFSIYTHVLIGLLPLAISRNLPFGFAILLHLFAIGLIIRFICSQVPPRYQVVSIPLFVALAYQFVVTDSFFNIRDLMIGDPVDWANLLLHDGMMITGFVSTLVISRWVRRFKFLHLLGKYSLIIYLSHGLINQIGLRVIKRGLNPDTIHWLILMGTSMMVTVLCSLLVAMAIRNIAFLNGLVTPKDYMTFKKALRIA